MSISEKFNKLIQEREKIEYIADWENEPVIKDMIKLFTNDMQETITFLDTECTEEQFSWLSEIFDDIAQKSQSKEFIAALRRTAKKFPQTVNEYNLLYFIDSAAKLIK